ncbi:uncharacterized protein (DUF58 family) [Mesonia algae]|uniref:Uncharacterized protein (DUF58 family) n=1 Tax=Mesonia algae TaxID=213248 RepID=A0A2W7HWA6_9FLAO|nr:DUF58 domain-containing protein [Mesonia algae]PZW37814.1 uncharacterized protein (DUF58 family) [Mesonia algae]
MIICAFAVLFLVSYWYTPIYAYIWLLALGFLLLTLADIILLFKENSLEAERVLPEKFSNSDLNSVEIKLKNNYSVKVKVEIIDEIPVQFQKRDFLKTVHIPSHKKMKTSYGLRPVERGEYIFGNLNCYVSSPIQLIKKRYTFNKNQMVKVFPSFIQMKKYDFLAIDNRISQIGLKKIRRIGHTMEFEQIKEYVQGDDIRTINWKATAKHRDIMVNQYQDEKSQPIYSIIDTSRVMKMPFNELKLIDYAINSTLAFSNIALKKKDKVGMLSFSHKIGNYLSANSKMTQLQLILNQLYNVDTKFLDSDFGLLYAHLKRKVTQRSLLMLYTNFEHISSLQRQLPYLKAISKKHVLVVIFFKNTELEKFTEENPENLATIYEQTIATQFKNDKYYMAKELEKHGIQTILTAPKDLSINTINKYLEIKARGIL